MTTGTLRTSLVALSLVALTCLASDSKSAADQYPARHDQSHPLPSLDETLKILKSRHRFNVKPKKSSSKDDYPFNNDIVPDLQVGCGDGLFLETTTTPRPPIPKHKQIYAVRKERKRRETGARKPRNYYSYTVHTPASVSYAVWKAQPYKTQRPYFIPIWGSNGRLPIYFPPQPIYLNPGFPLDNPPRKEYLPPTKPTTEVTIEDRFGDDSGKENQIPDDGPIWDTMPASTTRPTTRKPSTFPPLIHNLNPESGAASLTTTPPPPLVESAPSQERVPENSFQQPANSPQANNPCGWAIINCCSATSSNVLNSCFERLGCPGPFWDKSPCDSEFAREAIQMALNFYDLRSK